MGSMSWGTVASLILIGTTIWHAGMYVGILMNKVNRHDDRLNDYERRIDGHDKRIDDLDAEVYGRRHGDRDRGRYTE